MSITMNGAKKVLGSIWKSLPTEILILLSFLVALTQLDFLPILILQYLASAVSVVSFLMLFFRMYNSMAHEYVVKKAVRLAEKNYIQTNYENVRAEYIPLEQEKEQTIVQNVQKTLTDSKKSTKTKVDISEAVPIQPVINFP